MKKEVFDDLVREEEETEAGELQEQRPGRKLPGKDFFRGLILGMLLSGIVILMVLLFRFGTFSNRHPEGADVLTSEGTMRKMKEIRELIDDRYLFDVDGNLLETYLFRGVAAGLDDAYAAYYSAEDMVEVNRDNRGTYRGIGIVISQNDENAIFIEMVYEGSPAQREGVREGDIVLQIDGTPVDGLGVKEAANLISSDEDSVELTLERDGEQVALTVPLDFVNIAAVTWHMDNGPAGYLRIPEFDAVTVSQFEKAVDELSGLGMTGLVIDVRDNPGGLLDTLCEILDDLLPECLLISTQNRKGTGESLYARDGQLTEVPLVVLVNENTASAAEFFAGTLQDYGRAVIVGTDTFGKGIMQRTYELGDGSAFKLTTDKCLTGGGQDIYKVGVHPDEEISDPDDQLARALELLADPGSAADGAAQERQGQ